MNTEISKAVSPTNPQAHLAVSERARTVVKEHFDIRGRFAHLEELSGISADQWRNFYYAKQRVNEAMLAFLIEKFPDNKSWMLTGRHGLGDQDRLDASTINFPFRSPWPSDHDAETVGRRLNWVIRERVPDKGASLFEYLSKVSKSANKEISADDWAQVVLGFAEPTLDMVMVICDWNRQFTLWVLLGSDRFEHQVDPTDPASITEWTEVLGHRQALAVVEGSIPSSRTRSKPSTAKTAKPLRKHGNKKG